MQMRRSLPVCNIYIILNITLTGKDKARGCTKNCTKCFKLPSFAPHSGCKIVAVIFLMSVLVKQKQRKEKVSKSTESESCTYNGTHEIQTTDLPNKKSYWLLVFHLIFLGYL